MTRDRIEYIDKYGVTYNAISGLKNRYDAAIRTDGDVDVHETMRAAREQVETSYKDEFDQWLEAKQKQYGIKEKILTGYDENGNRKYIPNTLENASRIMTAEGRNNSTNDGTIGSMIAAVAGKADSLDEIRANKDKLGKSEDEHVAFKEKWSDVMWDIAETCYSRASDAWAGLYRLNEALGKKDPAAYLKRQYGVTLSAAEKAQIKEFIKEVRENFPAGYFETKFERPVMLNEFAAAVVPEGTSAEVVDALKSAGLDVHTYKKDDEADRHRVTIEASRKDGVRFSITDGDYDHIFTPEKDKFVESWEKVKENHGMVREGLESLEFKITPLGEPSAKGKNYTANIVKEKAKKLQGTLHWRNDPSQEVSISRDSADKFMSTIIKMYNDLFKEQDEEKKNKIWKEINAYVALLDQFKEVFNTSELVETHLDYPKTKNDEGIKGDRSDELEPNPETLMHRMFSAVSQDGNVFAAKFTVKETVDNGSSNPLHAYEVTEIELSDDTDMQTLGYKTEIPGVHLDHPNNSITGAKLLKGFEKKYDKGEKLIKNELNGDEKSNLSSKNAISSLSLSDDNPYDIVGQRRRELEAERAKRNAMRLAEEQVNTNPSEAQKKAGNYRMGHVKVDGMDVTIENPKGSTRSGKDADGKEWSVKMNYTYGYIRGTKGVDGDHIDVYLNDKPGDKVYVVDQIDQKTGEFDEHKVMYGFNSIDEAKDAYLNQYEKGWKVGNITEVSKDDFKEWIESSKRKTKPFSEYAKFSITPSKEWKDAMEEIKGDRDAEEHLRMMEPQTIDEVASQVLAGSRIMWNDEGDGEWKKKGMASELGWGEGERRKFLTLLATGEKGGKTIAELGEMIEQACRDQNIPFDDDGNAGRNAALSVLQQAGSASGVRNYIMNNRIYESKQMHEEYMQREEEFKAKYEEERDKHYLEEYGMTFDEYEAMRAKQAGQQAGNVPQNGERRAGIQNPTDEEIHRAQWYQTRMQRQAAQIQALEKSVESYKKAWEAERSRANGELAKSSHYQQTQASVEQRAKIAAQNAENFATAYQQLVEVKKQLTNYVKEQLQSDWMPNISKRELNKIMTAIQRTNTPAQIEKAMRDVQAVAAQGEVNYLNSRIDRMMRLKTQDVNGRNMSVAKTVDERTRKIMNAIKDKAANLKVTGLEDSLDEVMKQRSCELLT